MVPQIIINYQITNLFLQSDSGCGVVVRDVRQFAIIALPLDIVAT